MENRRQNKTVRNGQVKRIALAAVLSVIGTGLFAAESVLSGWKTSQNTSAREENGKVVVSVTKGEGSIYRYVYGKVGFIQLRISSNTRFYVQGKEFQLPPVFPKPGLYTIPASGKVQRMAAFNLKIMGREFAFSEFLSSEQPPAYSVTVQKEGDEIVVSMPVKDKPDSLTLTLYALNTGKNWKFTGMWKMLDWPGVPSSLKLEDDGVYRARFKLPELPQAFTAKPLALIAGVHMNGADNNDYGDYYGFFPFEVKIQASGKPTVDANLKIYDLGPKNIVPQAGAVRGDKALSWKGLGGNSFRGSARSVAYLDRMLTSWAEIRPGKTAKANLKLEKGKYHLAIGIGSQTLPSYAAHGHQPTSGCIKVNGKEIFRRNSADQDRDVFMRRMPDEKDNFFRLYFKDRIFFDINAEAEAGENGIQLEFIADPKKIMVVNYIIVYPADDRESAVRVERIRSIREDLWNRYLVKVIPKQKPFAMKTPFAVFPRENPDDNVCPDTLPSPVEKGSPLKLYGAPDEMLSGTFMVRTGGKHVKGLTVKLNGLPGGLYQVMYMQHSTGSERKTWIGANHLLPAESADLKPNYTYAWRIRLKGPAKPGNYRCTIEATADGHTEKLPVEVTVHPLPLPVLDDHYIAMDGNGIWGRYAADIMRFCKENLGCTTAHLLMGWPSVNRYELDQNGMPVKAVIIGGQTAKSYANWLDAYIKADFPVKTPWIGLMSAQRTAPRNQGPFKPFTKEYCAALRLSYEFLRDGAKQKGLPKILVDLGGEMGVGLHVPPPAVIESHNRMYQLINEIPGVLTSYRCNCYATVEGFNPYLAVQGVRGTLSWKSSDRITDYGKKKHIYTYSVGGRVRNGYHSWAHGARGNLREYLFFDHPFYRFTPLMSNVSTTHDESVMSGVNKPLMTVRSEAFRASVVDRQYLRILDNAVKDAPNSAAKAKAVALRDLLRNTCLNTEITEAYGGESSPWEGMRLDLMRQAIVECVLNLKKNDASAIPDYRKIALQNRVVKPEAPNVDPGTVPEEAKTGYQDAWWPNIKTGPWERQGYGSYDGVAWYRKTFELKELDNPRINFAGVDEQAWVWLNGKFLGHHNGWDQAFSFPLDQAAVKGKNNLSVLVFDSSFQGGIWRPVTVVNGGQKLVLNDWKFILKPGRQDLNEFQLKDGPLTPAGSKTLTLNIMLYGFRDVRMSPEMEIWLDGRKLSLKAVPYKRIVREIPVDPVGKGHHQLILKSNGKTAMTYDFYGI